MCSNAPRCESTDFLVGLCEFRTFSERAHGVFQEGKVRTLNKKGVNVESVQHARRSHFNAISLRDACISHIFRKCAQCFPGREKGVNAQTNVQVRARHSVQKEPRIHSIFILSRDSCVLRFFTRPGLPGGRKCEVG